MERIRILGVAPYEGLRSLMLKIAAENYPQIDLDVVVGDSQKGVEVIQNKFHSEYDVIISRGGTAEILRKELSLPVIEIKIMEYDILRAIHLADSFSTKHALVGLKSLTRNADMLSDLTSLHLKTFTIKDHSDIMDTLNIVSSQGYEAVISDNGTSIIAKQMGLNTILITSGPEGVMNAFDDAILLIQNMRRLQIENHFLKEIISFQSADTVVFDADKQLYFTTMNPEESLTVLKMLVNEIDNCPQDAPSRIAKSLNGTLYNIKARKFFVDSKLFTTFYVSKSKTPISSSRLGITYKTKQEVLKAFNSDFYSVTGMLLAFERDIDLLNKSNQPIMLLGEDGVGKEQIAGIIYARGPLCNHPLISINCGLLNEKTWDYLLSSHNSPFAQEKTTIYLSHMADSTPENRTLLLGALKGMDVCKRNRVILSCIVDNNEPLSDSVMTFIDSLSCLKLALPPLKELTDRIPAMISLYFNQLNASQASDTIGMEPAAIELMQKFPWPHNYLQMKRVLQELATISPTPIISLETVQRVLQLENTSPIVRNSSNSDAPHRFDLNRTLEEMEIEIIHRVIKECGDNYTAAAKRLGISRTTLWRFLNK